MSYEVIITDQAQQELEHACTWWAENRSAREASQWYDGMAEAIRSLAVNPARFPFADENDLFPHELHQLNYGLVRRPTHRIIFTIRRNQVVLLRIRHVAQKPFAPEDVRE